MKDFFFSATTVDEIQEDLVYTVNAIYGIYNYNS